MSILLLSFSLLSSQIHAENQNFFIESSIFHQKQSSSGLKKKSCHDQNFPHEHEPHEEHQEEQMFFISCDQGSTQRARRYRQRKKLSKIG